MKRLLAVMGSFVLLSACQSAPTGSGGSAGASSKADGSSSGLAASPAAALSPEAQRLIAAAKEKGETELGLSWSSNSMGGPEGVARYQSVFNAMYGTSVKINFTPGPSFPNMAGKIVEEAQAGQKASTDVLIGSDGIYASLLNRNAMEEYDYTKLSPRISGSMVATGNIAVEIYSTMPGVLYNPNAVSQQNIPKRLEDVLNPRWKGKIATDVDGAYFDVVAARPEWGADRMKEFVARLSPNIGGLIRAGEESRISTGEFDLMVLGNTHAVEDRAPGQPLEYTVPDDAASVRFVYLGVPRTSAHPNLAKLFVNMMVSAEGQKALYDVYKTDHYALPGSRTGEQFQALKSRGGSVTEVNVQYDLAHPELAKLIDDVRQILKQK